MKHHCQYLVFRCMDFRIQPRKLSSLLESIGCADGHYDLVSLAGSGKDILGKPGERDHLWKQVTLSQKLHASTDIIMLYHADCGAYGISDAQAEEQTQTQDLKKIQTLISRKWPKTRFTAYIIKGVKTNRLSLKKVI